MKRCVLLLAGIALLATFVVAPQSAFAGKDHATYMGPNGTTIEGDRCGSVEPSPARQQELFNQVNDWLAKNGPINRKAITTIPVAMHVVRSNSGAWDATDTQINGTRARRASYVATTHRSLHPRQHFRPASPGWRVHANGCSRVRAPWSNLYRPRAPR